jgi:hypothetical protein
MRLWPESPGRMADRAVVRTFNVRQRPSADPMVSGVVAGDVGESVVAVVGTTAVRQCQCYKRQQHCGRDQSCARPQQTQHVYTVKTYRPAVKRHRSRRAEPG